MRTCSSAPFSRAAVLAALGAIIAAAPAALADQITLVSNHDSTLYEVPIGEAANGAGAYMFVGTTNQGYSRRGLLSFDLAAIPAGATITSASLRLRLSRETGPSATFDLHRVLASWGEGPTDAGANGGGGVAAEPGDSTWNYRVYDSLLWTTPGGDFSPTVSASQIANAVAFYNWTSPQVTADVQGWLNNPSSNFGWLLKDSTEAVLHTAKRFDSHENSVAANRPQLTITYVIPAPGAAALAVCGGLIAFRRRR
jgi:hypothetical protein